jgi:Domain of unknown function (DUF5666)
MTRLGMFAVVGATALSVAACGSSNTAAPTAPAGPTGSTTAQAQAPSSAPAPGGTGRVAGLIASVTGNAAQVTQQNGNATVDFTSSTQVTEVTSAALSDVTAGSCVSVRPARGESQGGQSITARSVRVSPAVDGKCQQPPAGSPSSEPSPSNGPAGHRGVGGTVASVAGGTITVNGDDGAAPTTVAVTDKTRYSKQASASTQSIAQGKCMTAHGSLDGSGALQATTINLRPANDGKCPGEGGPHHGHGG